MYFWIAAVQHIVDQTILQNKLKLKNKNKNFKKWPVVNDLINHTFVMKPPEKPKVWGSETLLGG